MLLSVLPAIAYDFEVDGIYYNVSSAEDLTVSVTYETTSYNTYAGDLVIPATVEYEGKTYTVNAIGEYALYKSAELTSLSIPATVETIASPNFHGTDKLTKLVLNGSNEHLYLVNGQLRSADKKTLYCLERNRSQITLYNDNEYIEVFSNGACYDCKSIRYLQFPYPVKEICSAAFYGCSGLQELVLPSSLQKIGDSAFKGCTSLGEIYLPSGVESIGVSTFENCTSAESITINGAASIGNYAFLNCSKVKSVVLGEGVESIGQGAFSSCSSLASVECKSTVPPSLGPNAFYNAPSTMVVYVPEGCKAAYENVWKDMTIAEIVEPAKDKEGFVAINASNFPDDNFRMIVRGYDKDKDGYLSVSERGVGSFSWSPSSGMTLNADYESVLKISSVKGIEFFDQITWFHFSNVSFTGDIDLTKNKTLTSVWIQYCFDSGKLDCSGLANLTDLNIYRGCLSGVNLNGCTALNRIYSSDCSFDELDLTTNVNLTSLTLDWCDRLPESIDLSKNTALKTITIVDFSYNLHNIDLSELTELTSLEIGSTGLYALDLSNNTKLNSVSVRGSYPKMYNADYDGIVLEGLDMSKVSELTGGYVKDGKLFVDKSKRNKCIKYKYATGNDQVPTFDVELTAYQLREAKLDEATFPDEIFRKYVADNFDKNNDGVLDAKELSSASYIKVNDMGIGSLDGIEYLEYLTDLYAYDNHIAKADLSNNINLGNCLMRQTLNLGKMSIDMPILTDVDEDRILATTYCEYRDGNLYVTKDSYGAKRGSVFYTYDKRGGLNQMDVNVYFTIVDPVDIDENNFPDEKFREYVKTLDADADGILSFDDMAVVTAIDVKGLGIADLTGIANFFNLTSLDCSDNNLRSADFSKNEELTSLVASGNVIDAGMVSSDGFVLEGVDLAKVSNITDAEVKDGKIYVDMSKKSFSYDYDAGGEELSKLNVTVDYFLGYAVSFVVDGEVMKTVTVMPGDGCELPTDELNAKLTDREIVGWDVDEIADVTEDIVVTAIVEDAITIDVAHFYSSKLVSYIKENFDTNSNGKLTTSEIAAVDSIEFEYGFTSWSSERKIDGLYIFTSLESLELRDLKGSVDLSNFPKLKNFYLRASETEVIDFSKAKSLEKLSYINNFMPLDLSGCTTIKELYVTDNLKYVSYVNLSDLADLEVLTLTNNTLYSLDLSKNTKLKTVDIDYSNIHYQGVTVDIDEGLELIEEGFDMSKATIDEEAELHGSIVDGRFMPDKSSSNYGVVRYNYATGNNIFPYYNVNLSFNISISIDEKHFPDSHFRNYIANHLDTDESGALESSELSAVKSLNLYMDFIDNLKGIEYFSNLEELDCQGNHLVALDLSKNTKLSKLETDGNRRILDEPVSRDGFTLPEIDMSRVDPSRVFGAKIVDGKFVPTNNSTIAYDYATGLDKEGLSTVRFDFMFKVKPRVTFYDREGMVLAQVDVAKGEAATAPSAPAVDGFTFRGWSESIDEVSYDMDVYALYDVVSGGVADIYKVAIDEVNFPDKEFREVVSDFDTDKDGYLTTAELYAVSEINAQVSLISDLKGIEYFTELKRLIVSSNKLTSLDLSKNTKLTSLSCDYNKLTSLDLSNNKLLVYVYCSKNEIEELVLPKDNKIKALEIENNKIKEVDVASMPYLTTLACEGNSLLYLSDFNVESTSSSHIFPSFSGKDNVRDIELEGDIITIEGADLSRIFNLKGAYLTNEGLDVVDNTVTYDYYVGNCVHVSSVDSLILNVTINVTIKDEGIEINEENFPDSYFRRLVSDDYDTDKDGKLNRVERKGVATMRVSNSNTHSIVGVEYFTRLEELVCLSSLDSVDVTALTELSTLKAYGHFVGIDLSKNTKLTSLYINSDSLKSLDLSVLTELTNLKYFGKNIETIDLSNNLNLNEIDVQSSNIKYLDLSKNSAVEKINASDCLELETLVLPETNNYVSIDISRCDKLNGLDFTKTPNINTLSIDEFKYKEFDFTGCKRLCSLYCRDGKLAWIDLSFNITNFASTFRVSGNVYDAGLVDATGFTIEGLDMSRVTIIDGGEIVDGKFVPAEGSQEITYSFDTGWWHPSADFAVTFYTEDNLGVAIDEENFPDEVFRNYVATKFDSDENGYLRLSEIKEAKQVNIAGIWDNGHLVSYGRQPASLKGIEYFTYLTNLYVRYSLLEDVDLSKNTDLTMVSLDYSRLISLDLSNNSKVNSGVTSGSRIVDNPDYEGFTIDGLDMSKVTVTNGGSVVDGKFVPESDATEAIVYTYDTSNEINTLTVTLHLVKEGMNLVKIDEETFPDDNFRWEVSMSYDRDHDGYLEPDEVSGVKDMHLSGEEIGDFTGIEYFYNMEKFSCDNNNITTLDLSKNTKLTNVYCNNNQLTEVKLPENNSLTYLSLSSNQLESIDLSGCAQLKYLYLDDNQLTSLDLSGCKNLSSVQFSNNKLPYVDLTGMKISRPSADGQVIEMGEVSMDGFTIDGLDMSRVSNIRGGSKVDGKFVPNSYTSITYDYNLGCSNGWSYYYMEVTVKFTVIPGTPIGSITVDDGPAEYYDLQGRRITGQARGLVIKKQNGKSTKMLVK